MKDQDVIVKDVSQTLGIPASWLDQLIEFESGYRVKAANPNSSAKGLIQFIDSTAQDLGFDSSQDLVDTLDTFEKQMYGAVLPYLQRKKIVAGGRFPNRHSLYMAVFYPRAMTWPGNKEFPAHVQKVNPGIKTPNDYIGMVDKITGGLKKKIFPIVAGSLCILGAMWYLNKRKK